MKTKWTNWAALAALVVLMSSCAKEKLPAPNPAAAAPTVLQGARKTQTGDDIYVLHGWARYQDPDHFECVQIHPLRICTIVVVGHGGEINVDNVLNGVENGSLAYTDGPDGINSTNNATDPRYLIINDPSTPDPIEISSISATTEANGDYKVTYEQK